MSNRGFMAVDENGEDVPASGEVTLLIDGDIIAFTAAAAVQKVYEDEHGFVYPFASRKEGEMVMANMLCNLKLDLGASHTRIALTDPDDNWRRHIWPQYKAFRKDSARPLLLSILKQVLKDEHGAVIWDGLEADDVLGIWNTEPQLYPGKRILVGRDKDFMTVPGLYHKLKDYGPDRQPIVQTITPWAAQRFHLKQTLMGDATDGYFGCPNLGKVRAEELLTNPVLLRPDTGVITRGVNKGNSTTKWVAEPTRDLWAMVVSNYQKGLSSGLTVVSRQEAETEALLNARLANILTHDQYDQTTKELTLWTPSRIKQS